MKIQESGEMYLESIYVLLQQSPNVRSVDVANFTGYSKPSVSRAMGLLKKAELIAINDDGFISLSEKGINKAMNIFERHTILTEFFLKLGVDEAVASEDACKVEHVISEETFTAIKEHVSHF